MRRVLAALCISGATGCAPAPPLLPAAGAALAAPRLFVATGSRTIAPAYVERVTELFPAVAPPAERACSLASKRWSGNLQVGPGKPVYGTVSGGPTRLTLGEETRDGSAFAEAGDGALELVGTVDAPEIFSKAPLTLASFVIPLANTPLGWQPTGVVGRVGVTLDISDTFAVPGVVEKPVSCDKLTIDEPSWSASSFVTGGVQPHGLIGGGVELFLSPGSQPIARTKEGNYEQVVLLETRGRHTRVAIQASRYYAVGWVASETIGPDQIGRLGSMHGVGTGSGMSRTRGCKHDLVLAAEVAGARYEVGRLRAGGDFVASTLDVAEGFTALSVSASWFSLAPGAKLLVRTQDLAGC